MIVVGLTGPIGSGKSNIVQALVKQGVPCFDADACVHKLLVRPDIEKQVTQIIFLASNPEAVTRTEIADIAFNDPTVLTTLEELLHPLVWDECQDFLNTHRKAATPLVILDIPLLFEADYTKLCHSIIVLQCSRDILKERVLSRPGMTENRFNQILHKQGSWEEKSKQADYVLETDGPFEQTLNDLNTMLDGIQKRIKSSMDAPSHNNGKNKHA